MSRTFFNLSLKGREYNSKYVYWKTLSTDKIVKSDLDERNPVGSFGNRWVGTSRWTTRICRFWNSHTTIFLMKAKKICFQKSKLIKLQSLSLWRNAAGSSAKNDPFTNKNHTYAKFLATYSYQFLHESLKKDVEMNAPVKHYIFLFRLWRKFWQLLWGKPSLEI